MNQFQRLGFNFWMVAALVVANGYMWTSTLLATAAPHVVEAIRAPQVVALLDRIAAGGHSGETWDVTLTELEAEQTVTWYLQRYPQIPFKYPRIIIAPDFVSGEGDATIAGLRVHVGGRARITLKDGLPVVTILSLNLPLPPPIREALERELQTQLQRADRLPVRFTSADWQTGKVVVHGVIR